MKEKPLKIGVFLYAGDVPETGGGFSYVGKMISAIDKYEFDSRLQIVFVSTDPLKNNFKKDLFVLRKIDKKTKKIFLLSIAQKFFRIFKFTNLINKLYLNEKIIFFYKKFVLEQFFCFDLDIIFYPKPEVYIDNFPYIVLNWDIGHRTLFPFPEVVMNGEFERREKFYTNEIKKAFLIISESEQGKKELIDFYAIPANRIKVLPMFAGSIVDLEISDSEIEQILRKEGVNKPFFFYPAQFWAHKNHYHLVRAFSIVQSRYPEVRLVLTGSDKGNLDYIMYVIHQNRLSEHVSYLGFVDNKTLYALYKKAVALVMPTLLGPTNMPLLEARALNCPVLCSDLIGHRELMGEDAVYFDPLSPEDISEKMINCLKHSESQTKRQFTPSISILEESFLEILPIRRMF